MIDPPAPAATSVPVEYRHLADLLRRVLPELGDVYAGLEPRYDDADWVGARLIEILPLALTGVTRPITGAPWSLRLANVPANAIAGLDVFGLHDPALVDLAFLGAPGCGLRASPDVLLAWPIAGASRTFSLAIPNSTALWNLRVFASSVVFQSPPANALGLVVSNGLRGTIGDL